MDLATANATNAESGSTAPRPFLQSLFSLVHDMSAVQRFSRLRMTQPENVLTHTGMVCVFCYAITRRLIKLGGHQHAPLNMGWVLARATVHDMDETITGDIVRPTKYFSTNLRLELGLLEEKGIGNIANALDLPHVISDFASAKQGREGYVVKMADLLAALCTVYIEVCVCGNVAMVQAASGLERTFKELKLDAERWNAAELAVLDGLIEEARVMLSTVVSWANPLPSLHEER